MNYLVASVKNKHLNLLLTIFLSLLILLILFIEYWLLTGFFPVNSLLLLFLALIITHLINAVSGSVLGLTIEDIKNKISVLELVRGFELGMKHPVVSILNSLLGFLVFISWIVALIIYWNSSVMTPKTLFMISFFVFIVPQIVGIIIMNTLAIPALITTDYDNDLRNKYFINGFNNVLTTIVFIMLPLSLFYNYNADSASLPPYWLLLISPLLLFILVTMIPFLIGTSKFHHQQLYNIKWRLSWLNSISRALIMPDPNSKYKTLQEKLAELNNAIDVHKTQHPVLEFIDYINNEDDSTEAVSPDKYVDDIMKTKTILEIFKNNKDEIHDWDIRAKHLKKLQDLKNNINYENIDNCKGYINILLKDTEKEKNELSRTKSSIAGLIITAVTTIIGFLFKHYQDDIFRILGQLK